MRYFSRLIPLDLRSKSGPDRSFLLLRQAQIERRDVARASPVIPPMFDLARFSIAQWRIRRDAAIMRMRMKFRVSVVFLVMAAFSYLAPQLPAQQTKRSITEKDIFDFVWVANPQLSPDGARVAFTRVTVDEKRTGYETSIWAVSTAGNEAPIRMTNGNHDGQPRWAPDGKRIAFVRGGDKDDSGKPKPSQIALLSLEGGEAR